MPVPGEGAVEKPEQQHRRRYRKPAEPVLARQAGAGLEPVHGDIRRRYNDGADLVHYAEDLGRLRDEADRAQSALRAVRGAENGQDSHRHHGRLRHDVRPCRHVPRLRRDAYLHRQHQQRLLFRGADGGHDRAVSGAADGRHKLPVRGAEDRRAGHGDRRRSAEPDISDNPDRRHLLHGGGEGDTGVPRRARGAPPRQSRREGETEGGERR